MFSKYNQSLQCYADFLASFSHPKRLEILFLLKNHELSVSQIKEMLDLPQANISQHLMAMRQANVIKDRRDGKQIFYSLANEKIAKFLNIVKDTVGTDCIEEYYKDDFENFEMVTDPVCKMRFPKNDSHFEFIHEKNNYYFCASNCLKKFAKEPENYVNK